ncbi:anti-phage protein KwaA [Aeromonas salmonicida]|uniref:anti-phage protein KwaA n=1 Tax=Aeromonas salmonicida TaxID=645 RepID=UPI0038B73CF5
MKTGGKIKLYILSLMFLFFIILLMTINTLPCITSSACERHTFIDYAIANWLPILMCFLVVYCEVIRRQFEFVFSGNTGDSLRITKCESESYEHLTFLATYIIPFTGLNFDSIFRISAYLFLIIIIGVIFIKTEKYYANPTLAVFGYKLYRVTLSDQIKSYESVVVLTKSELKIGQSVAYQFISKNVCFVREINNG